MKKIFVPVILFLFIFSFNSFALNFEIGLDLKLSFPVGDFMEGFNPGFGYGLQFLYPINEKINTGVELSMLTLKNSDYDDLEFNETSLAIFGQYHLFSFKKFDLLALGKLSYNQQKITMGSGEETGNVGGFGIGIKCNYPINNIWILNSVLSFDIVDQTNRVNLIVNINYKYIKE